MYQYRQDPITMLYRNIFGNKQYAKIDIKKITHNSELRNHLFSELKDICTGHGCTAAYIYMMQYYYIY